MAAVSALLTYTTPTGPMVQTVQDEVIALINVLKNVIPDSAQSSAPVSPDWDQLHPRMADQIRAELDGIIAAVDATPIA